MINFADMDSLFCNVDKAIVLYDYKKELVLFKRLVELVDRSVSSKKQSDTKNFEGVCYLFARAIVDYAKTIYDNMILGHFDIVFAINRIIIENIVSLDIILSYPEKELWKYYYVYSFHSMITKVDKQKAREMDELFRKMYKELNIDAEFYIKRGEKPAYIDQNYGWTYKVNMKKQFTFAGLCELVDKRVYDDFKMMSEYSHGTSIYIKLERSIYMERIMNMISALYIALFRLFTMYCWEDSEEQEFHEVTDGLEWAIDVNEQAQERLQVIMDQMKKAESVTEELKEKNQMEWYRRMLSIHGRAEEIELNEIVYA